MEEIFEKERGRKEKEKRKKRERRDKKKETELGDIFKQNGKVVGGWVELGFGLDGRERGFS